MKNTIECKTKRGKKNSQKNLTLRISLSGVNKDTIHSTTPLGSIITFNLLQHETNENEVYILKLVDQKPTEYEISLESTTGQKINNSQVGDIIEYTRMGNEFTITILNIELPT